MSGNAAVDGQLYLSGTAVDELHQAQAELDEHLPAGITALNLRAVI